MNPHLQFDGASMEVTIRLDMIVWAIYQNPSDHPGKFVARQWCLGRPTDTALIRDTLDEVRGALPAGLTRLERDPRDDPVIVETWL